MRPLSCLLCGLLLVGCAQSIPTYPTEENILGCWKSEELVIEFHGDYTFGHYEQRYSYRGFYSLDEQTVRMYYSVWESRGQIGYLNDDLTLGYSREGELLFLGDIILRRCNDGEDHEELHN